MLYLACKTDYGEGGICLTDREIRMQKRLRLVWARPTLCRFLIVLGKVCEYSIILYFAAQLILHMVFMQHFRALTVGLIAAFGFGFVTVMRKLIPAKRPYEVLDFTETPPREKKGESFPSRHAYSAVVIAILSHALTPWCIIALIPLALGVCIPRAIVGIHYPKDIIVGALIGILFGVFGALICHYL